jgi:hypothetical protein
LTGDSFSGFTSEAVLIGSGATNINLQSNNYVGNTINVNNGGSIEAGNCTGISGTCTAGATP